MNVSKEFNPTHFAIYHSRNFVQDGSSSKNREYYEMHAIESANAARRAKPTTADKKKQMKLIRVLPILKTEEGITSRKPRINGRGELVHPVGHITIGHDGKSKRALVMGYFPKEFIEQDSRKTKGIGYFFFFQVALHLRQNGFEKIVLRADQRSFARSLERIGFRAYQEVDLEQFIQRLGKHIEEIHGRKDHWHNQ